MPRLSDCGTDPNFLVSSDVRYDLPLPRVPTKVEQFRQRGGPHLLRDHDALAVVVILDRLQQDGLTSGVGAVQCAVCDLDQGTALDGVGY